MGVVHRPNAAPDPERPDVLARDYPVGTVWESKDGSRWVTDWSALLGFQWLPLRTDRSAT